VPKGDYFQQLVAHAVVDEIFDPRQVQPSYHFGSWHFHLGPKARFFDQQRQRGFNVFANRSRRSGSVLGPPLGRTLNLVLRTRLDSDAERHSAETTESCEQLFGRDALFSISFVEGSKEISFLLRREFHDRLVAPSQDSDGGALRQGETFDHNLPADHGA
jgi:hypothetical protein